MSHCRLSTFVMLVICLGFSACSDVPAGKTAIGSDAGILDGKGSFLDGWTLPELGVADQVASTDSEFPSDGVTSEVATPDISSKDVATQSDFGTPCKSDADCSSGFCVEGYSGYVCTQICTDACPGGFACKTVTTSKGTVKVCLAQVDKSCRPCQSDLDCAGGSCVTSGDEQFCASACGAGLPSCPASHECKEIVGAPGQSACQPTSGTCACSAKSVGLIRACQQASGPKTCYGVEICQNPGKWSTCQLPAEVCNGQDDNCDGAVDDGFVDGNGKYTTVQACGQCGINCAVLKGEHAQAVCDVGSGGAQCKLSCDNNWLDVNANPNDGCECEKVSAKDEPDGVDQNCDGIDGEVNNGVFVALTGKDGAAGTMDAPVAAIAAAIQIAVAKGKRDVYVATGVYDGSLSLAGGVHVYGGYSPDFKKYDSSAYQTVILGGTATKDMPGAVNAMDLKVDATLDGFHIYGASTKQKGASTYGIYVRDTGNLLRIRHNRVLAGDAGGGSAGFAGKNGAAGEDGSPGVAAADVGFSTCLTADQQAGGKGGTFACGVVDVSGGAGGTAICPDFDEDGTQPKSSPYKQTLTVGEQGGAGKGTGGGAGGASGYDSLIPDPCTVCNPPKAKDGDPYLYTTGLSGVDGSTGSFGTAGDACGTASGTVSAALWQAASASKGGDGGPGGGGGGGGAGGGVEVAATCTSNVYFKFPDVGGSGGGGGSGGCGGTGGTSGGGGGGSFALFVVYTKSPTSLPNIVGNVLVTGNGGDGGAGGQGGVGGLAGDGKLGGGEDVSGLAWCASGGGRGGQGGGGGHGGGGGGGCGGPSFGVFVSGAVGLDAGSLKSGNTVQILGVAGSGGAGGKSLGKSGGEGSGGGGGIANF